MATDTIPRRLQNMARQQPGAPAYFVRGPRGWEATSFADYAAEVHRAARALMALGFEPGSTVSILGFNRPEWVIMDLAAMSAGGAPAGVYTTCSPAEVRYIVHHAESPVVLVEDRHQWEKIRAERENMPDLKHIVLMRDCEEIDDPETLTWEQFLARGDEVAEAKLEKRIDALEEDALATLIYTSGTTGPPKGVMLSHRNLAWTAGTARDMVEAGSGDCALSYLPLSHIAEQMFTIHGAITAGYSIYFAESIEKVPDNLRDVQPTVFFGVPRIWEKFHSGILGKMAGASAIQKKLVAWARHVGHQVIVEREAGRTPGGLLALQYSLADRLIYSKLKEAVGLSRARFCVSGAAPLGRDVIEFFASLGILVLEVYGQSEDCGPTSFNRPEAFKIGTVGRPIPGVEVRIAAEDGEVLVHGPNVFLGYYKDPEATAEALTEDGWLRSGDIGVLDKEGYLSITGRKKDIIITAGGKNITPKNIEATLKTHDLINEAVVIGDRRKFLSALVTLDPEGSERFALEHRIEGENLHENPRVREEVQRAVDEANQHLARVEQIKKFTILPRNLTIEDGELTPTMKVKRRIVDEHFADEIEAMYRE